MRIRMLAVGVAANHVVNLALVYRREPDNIQTDPDAGGSEQT
jgi:hypothetical protein